LLLGNKICNIFSKNKFYKVDALNIFRGLTLLKNKWIFFSISSSKISILKKAL
jgi:hypothetical protein